jgi:hypothetical protein
MLMPVVVAVALGIAPVNHDGSVPGSNENYAAKIGHYTESVDRRGTTHITGRDSNGRRYELVMTKNGYVEASVGEHDISFRVENAI